MYSKPERLVPDGKASWHQAEDEIASVREVSRIKGASMCQCRN